MPLEKEILWGSGGERGGAHKGANFLGRRN